VGDTSRNDRWKRRKRENIIVAQDVEVPPGVREVLLESGFLREWDDGDPKAIARAIERLLAAMRTESA
jgi:hypothetical protein